MSVFLDPLSIISMLLMHVGGKYLDIQITKAQEKILKHPITQMIIFFSIIYITTKNIYLSFTILLLTYIIIKILFNENHEFNILSKEWLKNEGIINDADIISIKKLYYDNLNNLHL